MWVQSEWIFTEPLFRVQAGDTLRVRGWILVPENNGGSVSLGLDYLNGIYERYDRERLHANIQPYADWAETNNVPLWVGEFGAMSSAPGNSRYNLVSDTIRIMNEAGLHWTLWAYRDGDPPSFGLYLGDDLDERLAEILSQLPARECRTPLAVVLLPWLVLFGHCSVAIIGKNLRIMRSLGRLRAG